MRDGEGTDIFREDILDTKGMVTMSKPEKITPCCGEVIWVKKCGWSSYSCVGCGKKTRFYKNKQSAIHSFNRIKSNKIWRYHWPSCEIEERDGR